MWSGLSAKRAGFRPFDQAKGRWIWEEGRSMERRRSDQGGQISGKPAIMKIELPMMSPPAQSCIGTVCAGKDGASAAAAQLMRKPAEPALAKTQFMVAVPAWWSPFLPRRC